MTVEGGVLPPATQVRTRSCKTPAVIRCSEAGFARLLLKRETTRGELGNASAAQHPVGAFALHAATQHRARRTADAGSLRPAPGERGVTRDAQPGRVQIPGEKFPVLHSFPSRTCRRKRSMSSFFTDEPPAP